MHYCYYHFMCDQWTSSSSDNFNSLDLSCGFSVVLFFFVWIQVFHHVSCVARDLDVPSAQIIFRCAYIHFFEITFYSYAAFF